MTPGNARGAVDEDEDHAAEGPGDAENADAIAGVADVGLVVVADDGEDGDVEEEKGGDELGDESPVEGPLAELGGVVEWDWGWVVIVLVGQFSWYLGFYVLGHGCESRKIQRCCVDKVHRKLWKQAYLYIQGNILLLELDG